MIVVLVANVVDGVAYGIAVLDGFGFDESYFFAIVVDVKGMPFEIEGA